VKLTNYIFGLAALCVLAFTPITPAHAQQGNASNSALLDALVKKGVLSDKEAQDITAQEEKQYSTTAASKINMPSSIKSITFYGDLRLRYEMRQGTTPSGFTGTGGALLTHGDTQTLNRYRYRLRFGLKGELYDNFFYGLRASSNPYFDRSGNVNFGASDSGGEFGKGRNILALDQVYLGWKPTSDITLTGGQMPQPLYTTNMVWDDNLNPAGAAEQWDHKFDSSFEAFATAGQFVYAAANGNGISNALGAPDASTTFMFAEQVGFKYNFDKNTFFKGAATIYTYSGSHNTNTATVAGLYSAAPSALGAPNNSPSFFNGPFVGAASAPESNVSGINDLAVLEFPMEFDFKIGPGVHQAISRDPKDVTTTSTGWELPVRIFSDFAYNIDAGQRADAARRAINALPAAGGGNVGITGLTTAAGAPASNQPLIASPTVQGVLTSGKGFLDQSAYEIGAEFGGLKKKGDWDGKLYWQSTGYYALDPNLVDADIFNAATNLQGIVASVAYNWTDGLSSQLRYAYGMPVNGKLATPNVNQDLTLGDIRTYNLFQADLMWKF